MSMLSNNTTIGGKKPLLPSNEYTDNGPSKEKLGIVYENITGSVNLNDYRTEGNYTFYNLTSASNFPSGTWTGNNNSHLTVQRFKDSNYCIQVLTKQSSLNMYIRYSNGSSSWLGWQKIWNALNDGANSGLDADLLDGVQGSTYLKNNQKGTDFNSCSTPGIYAMYRSGGVLNSPTNAFYYGCITCATDGNTPSGYIAQIAFTDNSSTGKVYIRYKTGNSTWNTWHTLWAGNDITKYLLTSNLLSELKKVDGTGSGLDADLLDGKHASEFALKSEISLQETDLILADERLKYYGDKDIVPSDESYFTVNETGETITGLTTAGNNQTDIIIPYKIDGKIITTIETGAFNGKSSIQTIIIPNSIIDMHSNIFSACYSLNSINIPNGITKIEAGTFRWCESLTTINLPNAIQTIQLGAFSGCTSLTSINIPKNVTRIDYNTFENCTSLTSIIIPKTVSFIDDGAFNGCTNLTIYCEQGSYAETYAKTINIPVVYTDVKAEILNGKVDKASLIEATAEDIDNWIGTSDTTSVVGDTTAGNAIVGM